MMRILYATNTNLALTRAHVKNIKKTAEALAETGRVECRIAAPFRFSTLMRERHTFDVLYMRDHYLFAHAWVAKHLLGKKIVYEVHSTHGWYLLRRLLFATADGAVFITKKLQVHYDPQRRKPAVVAHSAGVDIADFLVSDTRHVLRSLLHLPPDAYLAVYVGSVQWYDLALLVDMLALLPSDVVLVLGGVKEDEAIVLHERADSLGVGTRVVFPGRIAWGDVPRYFLSADVLVNPLMAGLPGSISSKLYEYLAAGRPIVSTRGGANDEVLHDGENALVVDCTKESFAYAIKRLRSDSAFAERLATRAREDAKQYTWRARAERIVEVVMAVVK